MSSRVRLTQNAGLTIYEDLGRTYLEDRQGSRVELQPPDVPFPLNPDVDRWDENLMTDDGNEAWTRQVNKTAISDDGAQACIIWWVQAYEYKYGWEYSGGFRHCRVWLKCDGDDSAWRIAETQKQLGDELPLCFRNETPPGSGDDASHA